MCPAGELVDAQNEQAATNARLSIIQALIFTSWCELERIKLEINDGFSYIVQDFAQPGPVSVRARRQHHPFSRATSLAVARSRRR